MEIMPRHAGAGVYLYSSLPIQPCSLLSISTPSTSSSLVRDTPTVAAVQALDDAGHPRVERRLAHSQLVVKSALHLWHATGHSFHHPGRLFVSYCGGHSSLVYYGELLVRTPEHCAYIHTCCHSLQYAAVAVRRDARRRWDISGPLHWYFLSMLVAEAIQATGA